LGGIDFGCLAFLIDNRRVKMEQKSNFENNFGGESIKNFMFFASVYFSI
jgi:hypothetical protein